MGKFFLPVPRGERKQHLKGVKKTKILPNCNENVHKTILGVLKKLLTRQTQKTIRKIHDENKKKEPQVLQERLLTLRSLTKADLSRLSFHIITQELNVDPTFLKPLIKKTLNEEQIQLPKAVQMFHDLIKTQNYYKNEVEDAQRLRNTVNEKKQIKKQKSKIKKKMKIEIRKGKELDQSSSNEKEENQFNDKIEEQDQGNDQNSQSNNHKESPIEEKVQKQVKTQLVQKVKKQEKTEFKKTGRNKYLQEKRAKAHGYDKFRKPLPQSVIVSKTEIKTQKRNDRNQTPHPSWEAKRALKNQMFIQPFQGKRIML